MVFMYAYWLRTYKAFGAAHETRTRTLGLAATDFKSVVSTNSTTAAYGCVRLDSNQRFPAYEAGDLDLLSTPQYKVGSFKSYPGLHLVRWIVLRGGFSAYNHRQSPPLEYLNNVLRVEVFVTFVSSVLKYTSLFSHF